VALEQYRTQVLLLHSEQSTLDTLGSGFNDRYSVHFATTGSEALTTLGETPIHIIVSAQDLPGMSGLEALREAKKRSPDTIGILLAGKDSSDGLEALVGDKEVFQIVRGAIAPDALLKIVENATRRVRMLTLSQSANDTAANVDISSVDSEGEHIVMETAENGTTIISDGTGRMPALKPEKIQLNPVSKGRSVDVLVLSKDSEFLETIRESSKGLHTVHHAVTAQQAQDAVSNHPVGVLVTDAAIAGGKIELLTQKLRVSQPRLVAIVAGRRDDGEMLMDLINRGQVYRFLLKPVSPGRARLAVEASVKHHLEAADTAFKGAASVATDSKPAPAVKPVPAPAPAAAAPAAPTAPPAPAKPVAEPKAPAPQADDDNAEAMFADVENALTDTGSLKATVAEMTATIGRAKKKKPAKSGFGKLPVIGGGVALLMVAGAAWMFMGGSPEVPADAEQVNAPAATPEATREPAASPADSPAAVVQEPAAAVPAPVEQSAPTPEYVALLDNARFARDSGRILAPAGDNAVEWYVAARASAPNNRIVGEELGALVEQVIGMAETALLENRVADASTALQMVGLASPNNPRLAFLNAQLAQIQIRAALDSARSAIRESRFEDASRFLTTAQGIDGVDIAQINQLSEDLAAARSAQRVDDVLAQANARLGDDQLIAPSNNNARYFFELALSNDPGNTAAQQGLLVVASKLVLKARAAIDSGDLDAAGAYLEDARALDPDGSELQASEAALENARDRQAEAERLAAVARQAAARDAELQRAAEERRRSAASATLSSKVNDPVNEEQVASSEAGSADPQAGNQDAGDTAPEAANYAPAAQTAAPQTVAISQLTRVNYVAPQYPRNAQRRSLSGWVDVGFTVTPDGTVSDLEIIDSTPGSVFDQAAADAVEKWRFEPVMENGQAVSRRVAVRMSFSLE
jgi:periplasmic protein TonB